MIDAFKAQHGTRKEAHQLDLRIVQELADTPSATWVTYDASDGRASDGVTAVAVDVDGNRWFGHDGAEYAQSRAGAPVRGSGGVAV